MPEIGLGLGESLQVVALSTQRRQRLHRGLLPGQQISNGLGGTDGGQTSCRCSPPEPVKGTGRAVRLDWSAKSWDLLSLLLGRQEEKTQQSKFSTSTPKHPEVSRRTSSPLQTRMGRRFPCFKKQGMKSIPVHRSSTRRCRLWYLVVWMEHQLSDPEKSPQEAQGKC